MEAVVLLDRPRMIYVSFNNNTSLYRSANSCHNITTGFL